MSTCASQKGCSTVGTSPNFCQAGKTLLSIGFTESKCVPSKTLEPGWKKFSVSQLQILSFIWILGWLFRPSGRLSVPLITAWSWWSKQWWTHHKSSATSIHLTATSIPQIFEHLQCDWKPTRDCLISRLCVNILWEKMYYEINIAEFQIASRGLLAENHATETFFCSVQC